MVKATMVTEVPYFKTSEILDVPWHRVKKTQRFNGDEKSDCKRL